MGQSADDFLLDWIVLKNALDRLDIDPRRRQQLLSHGLAESVTWSCTFSRGMVEDNLARQTVAVGVQAGGGQAEDDVAPSGCARR